MIRTLLEKGNKHLEVIVIVKSELIHKTWENSNKSFPKKDVEFIINAFIETLGNEMKNDCNIKIEGLGTFASYIRQAYVGKNISNGNIETIPTTRCISFTPSKKIKNKL